MKTEFKRNFLLSVLIGATGIFGINCQGLLNNNSSTNAPSGNAAPTTAQTTPSAPSTPKTDLPITLPVLDAMFADEKFSPELKTKLGLTDEQIEKLKQTAKEATTALGEDEKGSTSEATHRASEQIRGILGEEKANEFAKFVADRWANGDTATGEDKTKPVMSNANQPNAVPTDTRIVVNAPAYRMDLFKDGQLVKSYKIGIGYPEFPLPAGMREASTLIFNPTWTPPDEPWVRGKVRAGKKIEAGSSLNPLGPVKIPIGLPSLIHGGKQEYKLGGFASHGCVGLTNPQVQSFSLDLAQLSGTSLTAEDIAGFAKNKKETKNVKLDEKIPVELRYETIVVEDGVLKIYRDVYERGTNTEANLKKVLEANGVSFDSLSKDEQAEVTAAVRQMAVDAGGQKVTAEEIAEKAKAKKNSSKTVTRVIKGKKEIAISIDALKGKGYPAPVDLNVGGKSTKPIDLTAKKDSASGNSTNLSNKANANQTMPSNTNSAGKK